MPTIRANAAPRLAGNFFSVDLQQGRAAFESVPWVRRAVVRRVWPDRLAVRLEEHRAAALWEGPDAGASTDRLVNGYGEVFEANVGDVEDEGLPSLRARRQRGLDAGDVPARAVDLRAARPACRAAAPVRAAARGVPSWTAAPASNSAVAAKTSSSSAPSASCARSRRSPQRWKQPLEYADLRHVDGYAVRLRGVSTTSPPAGGAAPRAANTELRTRR